MEGTVKGVQQGCGDRESCCPGEDGPVSETNVSCIECHFQDTMFFCFLKRSKVVERNETDETSSCGEIG